MTGWRSVLLVGIGAGSVPAVLGLMAGNVGLGLG